MFADPVTIHPDWPLYATAFGGTGDVIYGIDHEGRLFWHKHVDAASGGRTVRGPIQIGTGWNSFVRTFCAGGGYIFGVFASGMMVAYHFLNWGEGPVTIRCAGSGPCQSRGVGGTPSCISFPSSRRRGRLWRNRTGPWYLWVVNGNGVLCVSKAPSCCCCCCCHGLPSGLRHDAPVRRTLPDTLGPCCS